MRSPARYSAIAARGSAAPRRRGSNRWWPPPGRSPGRLARHLAGRCNPATESNAEIVLELPEHQAEGHGRIGEPLIGNSRHRGNVLLRARSGWSEGSTTRRPALHVSIARHRGAGRCGRWRGLTCSRHCGRCSGTTADSRADFVGFARERSICGIGRRTKSLGPDPTADGCLHARSSQSTLATCAPWQKSPAFDPEAVCRPDRGCSRPCHRRRGQSCRRCHGEPWDAWLLRSVCDRKRGSLRFVRLRRADSVGLLIEEV